MGKKRQTKVPPFEVKDCALITLSTGLRSHNLIDLRDKIAQAPLQSIYHHFYEGLLRPSFDDPVYRNDFAVWAHRGLRDEVLAERLGGLDPMKFDSIEELKQGLLDIVEDRLYECDVVPWARPGSEFYFLSSKLIIFDTHLRLVKPSDLRVVLPQLTSGSIYFHFIEAQRREPKGIDDFSRWLHDWGNNFCDICEKFRSIDYHFFTLCEIRRQLLEIVEDIPLPTAQTVSKAGKKGRSGGRKKR